MKKIGLISLLALLVSVVMIGCGGNSKQDPIPPVPTNGYQLTNVTTPFDIGYAGQEKDFKIQLLKNGLPVSGEKIMTESLPAVYGFVESAMSVTDDSGYAVFHYKAADPLTNGIRQLALIHYDEDNISTIDYLNINIQDGSVPFEYRFVNVTTPVEITQPSESAIISITMVDKNNVGVPGKVVNISPLPSTKYGTINPISTTTDASGNASFSYVAPSDLVGLTSIPLSITYIGEGKSISEKIEIVFGKPGYYKLVNTSTPINISAPSQSVTISVDLVNPDNVGVPGKVITISALPCTDCGVISPISTTTGSSGRATFTYVAPDKLEGLTTIPLTLSFTEGSVTITQNIQIVFEKAGYRLVNATTPILINNGGQEAEISVYLVDKENIGVAGESVTALPIAVGYGTVDPGVATTEDSGRAVFTYQAPLHLAGLTSTTLTLTYTDEMEIVSANVEIQISGGGHTGYQLVNAKDPYYIYSPTQPDTFDIQLIKDGFPVVGMETCASTTDDNCVALDAINRRFGRFEQAGASDGDGYLHYNYIAPSDDEKAANGEDTHFTVVYIDADGKIAAESAPVSLRMRY